MVSLHPGMKKYIPQNNLLPVRVIIFEIHTDCLFDIQIPGTFHGTAGSLIQPAHQAAAHILLHLFRQFPRHLPHNLSGHRQHFPLHHMLEFQNGLQKCLIGFQFFQYFRICQQFIHSILLQRMALHNLHSLFGKQLSDFFNPGRNRQAGVLPATLPFLPDFLLFSIFPLVQILQHFFHFHKAQIVFRKGNLSLRMSSQHQPPSV